MALTNSVYDDLQSLAVANDRVIWRRIFDKIWKSDPTTKIVNITSATISITAALHAGKTLTLNKADGITATMPAATGSGEKYRFIVGTTITSGVAKIAALGADTMVGGVTVYSDDATDVTKHFKAGGTDDYMSMNGTTKGGYVGDVIELTDIASGLWHVAATCKMTSSEATPFGAT